ncbi:MAG: succinate dehydrogenase, hydrophobic membrane anchor protein [Pseudomonadota bacterium]
MRRRPVENDGTGHRGQRTALKTVRGLGTARSGTEHFIQQRVTGLANGVLVFVLAVIAIMLSGKSYAEALAFVGSPWVAVPLALAVVSTAVHMKLGIQVVIEDYIHAEGTKVLLVVANTFFAVFISAAAVFAIVKIMLVSLAVDGTPGVQ